MKCPSCEREGFYIGFKERDCGNERCEFYSPNHKEDEKKEEKLVMPDWESCGTCDTSTTTTTTSSSTQTCYGCGGCGCSTCNGSGYVTTNTSSISGSSTTSSNQGYSMP